VPAFFATAAKGTEGALRDELRMLRFRGVRADRGGVHFDGAFAEGMYACLEVRCAMRILLTLGTFEAASEGALYDGVRSLDFSPFVSTRTTLAVRASARSSALTHSQYIAQKTKDAIVDQLRDMHGSRPDVDLDDPDVVVSVHLAKDVATIYLDLAGRPLFMRGYRTEHHDAPLKETLAASMLVLSGWAREPEAFVDPMCGSGTIAIEAALIASAVAPGLVTRRAFGFERWASHGDAERAAYREIVTAAEARAAERARGPLVPIVARDLDAQALAIAQANAQRAGVKLRFERGDVASLREPGPLTVVTNPPYGSRMSMPIEDQRAMGRSLASLSRARIGVISGDPMLLRAIPMKPAKVITMMNGDLECGYAMYERTPIGGAAPARKKVRS